MTMQLTSIPLTAAQLREKGRHIQAPFCLALPDGRLVHMENILRLVPKKRIVGRARLGDATLLLKLFIGGRGQARRHSKRERAGVLALAQGGCLTPTLHLDSPLAEGGIALGFEFLPEAQTLGALWEKANPTQIHKLMEGAMNWLAHLHQAGLQQNDMHWDNLLYSAGRWYGIDGDGIDARHIGCPLPNKQRVRNMALFFAQLKPNYDVHIPHWLTYYHTVMPDSPLSANPLLHQVAHWRRWRLRRYANKSVRACSDFRVYKNWRQIRVLPKAQDTPLWQDFLDHIETQIRQGEPLKQGNSAAVVRVQVAGQDFVIKRYSIKNSWHALSRFFRPSRAWISWKNAHRLGLLGIATPKPIALMEKRYGPLRREAFFITEYCPGRTLLQYAHQDGFQPQSLQEPLLSLMTHLARHRICHGDCKASNLLVDAHYALHLIDLDAMEQYRLSYAFNKGFAQDIQRFMKNWHALPDVHAYFLNLLKPLIPPTHYQRHTELSHHES